MSKVTVHQAEDGNVVVANPILGKVEEALAAVRRRAFELFEKRGCAPDGELDDWLQAEKELFVVLQAEVNETARVFRMRILVPGFEARDLDVIALPQALWVEVKMERQTEAGRGGAQDGTPESKSLYRRFDLPVPIKTDKVAARIAAGDLGIEAPKKIVRPIPVRTVAA